MKSTQDCIILAEYKGKSLCTEWVLPSNNISYFHHNCRLCSLILGQLYCLLVIATFGTNISCESKFHHSI